MAYNPFFFLGAPSISEKIEALKNAVILLHAKYDDIEKIVKELKAYLDDLDDTIKDDISEIIDEMYESGELGRMVARLIDEDVQEAVDTINANPKTTILNFSRMFRKPHYMQDRTYDGSYQTAYYSYMEGGTVITYNGVKYIVYSRLCSNYSTTVTDDEAKLTVINMSGEEINTTEPLDIYHANSMVQVGEWLYSLDCIKHSGGVEKPSHNVSRIHIGDLVTGEAYPRVQNTTISYSSPPEYGPSGITVHGGKLYINCQYALYEFDWSTGHATLIHGNGIAGKPDFDAHYMQDMAITDDFVYYLVYRPSCIVRFNKAKNAVDWVYQIPYLLNDGMFKAGEVEWIHIEGDDIILGTSQHWQYKQVNQMDLVQFFVGNFNTNNKIATNNHSYTKQGYESERLIVYVDNTNTNLNPNGGQANPFASIVEALWYVQNIEQYKTAIIRLHSNSYFFGYVCTDKNILITSHDKTSGENAKHTIGGLYAEGAGHIALENVKVALTLPHDRSSDDCVNRFLRFKYCTWTVSNVDFVQPSTAYFTVEDKIYGLAGSDCIGTFAYSSGSGTSESTFNGYSNRQFTNFRTATVNGHGLLTTSVNIIA